MLVVTTLSQPATARVSIAHDVRSQIATVSLVRSLSELLELVTTWWAAHTDGDPPAVPE